MELELHDFDNKFKQDIPEEEISFIEPDFDQDVENSLLNQDQETSFVNDDQEDFEFHLIGLKENMRLVDKRKRLKEYTGLDIDPKKGRFSKALLEDIEFTWRDDQGWSGILYRNKPVYRMTRGDMIPLPNERIYPQFKMAVDLARDKEEKKEEELELETWLESRLKSIEEELPSEDLKELKNITSVKKLEEKATEYRKLKHVEEDNEDYKLLEEYTLLLSDQLRIEQGSSPEEHDTLVEQKKLELLRKLKQGLAKYLPYGVLTGVITTIGYIIDYTIGSKSKIGVGAHEIKNEKDHDERIKEIDERIEEIKKEKEKLAKEELDRKIDQEIDDHIKKVEEKIMHVYGADDKPKKVRVSDGAVVEDKEDDTITINSVKSKTNLDKNLKTYTVEKKGETPKEYLKRRKKERQEKLDKILNDPSTKLETSKKELGFPVSQKEQESISIGKTVIIVTLAAVAGVSVFYVTMVPVYAFTSISVFKTSAGYKTAWITYSAAAYAAAITGITSSEAAEKLQEPLEKIGTSLYSVGKPAFNFWYWLSMFLPEFVVNILWLIYKIIITFWNFISTILSIPFLDLANFGFDHAAILLFCGIVFYLLFYQGTPIDILLLFVPWVLIFTMIHIGYKIKNYFYPPRNE